MAAVPRPGSRGGGGRGRGRAAERRAQRRVGARAARRGRAPRTVLLCAGRGRSRAEVRARRLFGEILGTVKPRGLRFARRKSELKALYVTLSVYHLARAN